MHQKSLRGMLCSQTLTQYRAYSSQCIFIYTPTTIFHVTFQVWCVEVVEMYLLWFKSLRATRSCTNVIFQHHFFSQLDAVLELILLRSISRLILSYHLTYEFNRVQWSFVKFIVANFVLIFIIILIFACDELLSRIKAPQVIFQCLERRLRAQKRCNKNVSAWTRHFRLPDLNFVISESMKYQVVSQRQYQLFYSPCKIRKHQVLGLDVNNNST